MECDSIVTINHVHEDEEATRLRVLKMVQRVHARHRDFIDSFLYEGKEISSILDNSDFIQKKAEICTAWVLNDKRSFLSLFRNLSSYFEAFSLEIE